MSTYLLGPYGTNAWDGKKAVLRVAHTLERPGAWVLDQALADTIFREVVGAIRVKSGARVVCCPTCFSLKGAKTVVFVDVGGAIRGPTCTRCLKLFFSKYPNTRGHRLYIFSAGPGEIAFVEGMVPKAGSAELQKLRGTAVPLESLI